MVKVEQSESKEKLNKDSLLWLFRQVRRQIPHIIGLMLLQMVVAGCSLAYSLLFRQLIDGAVAGQTRVFYKTAAAIAALVAAQLLLSAVGRALDEHTRSGMENALKRNLLQTLLTRDYAAVTAVHTGEWMNRLTGDTSGAADGAVHIIPQLGGMLVRLVGALTVIVVLVPQFGILLVIAAVVMILATRVFRPLLKRLHKQIREADGAVRVFIQERLENQAVIRVFSQEKPSVEQAGEKMNRHHRIRMKRNAVSNIYSIGFGAAIQALYLVTAIHCGMGIIEGSISFGTLTAILQLIGQLQAPLSGLSGFIPRWYAMQSSAERLMEAERFSQDTLDRISQMEAARFYEREFTALRLEKVSFAYPGREERGVLDNLDLEIRKREFVALTGHSGCGKTTLQRLLLGLYRPDSGRIMLSESMELTPAWRNLFAYVPQGNQLISGTVRQILTFYDEEAMKRTDDLWRALRIACADDFVARLDKGLDTLLGERGCGLSEGQLQRLAIARAVFSGRPILLLDEATSALDEQTENRVLENLRTMTDRTVLFISHHAQVRVACDRIIELSEVTQA